MKTCAYCGFENEDAVTVCGHCGTKEFKSSVAAQPEEQKPSGAAQLRIRDLLGQPDRLFRCLVVVAAAGPLVAMALPRIESHFLAYETINLLNRNGHGALIYLPGIVWWLSTLLWVAIAYGLYHFSARARMLFTVFTLAFGVLGLFSGVCITSPLDGFVAWVIVIAQGAILVFAYCTPLKERFS